jgi:hypothetical protein
MESYLITPEQVEEEEEEDKDDEVSEERSVSDSQIKESEWWDNGRESGGIADIQHNGERGEDLIEHNEDFQTNLEFCFE